jgi:hypothetical protein
MSQPRGAPRRNAPFQAEDDSANHNFFPKVTDVISSRPISSSVALCVLAEFLDTEKEHNQLNAGRRRRWDQLYHVGEALAQNDADRAKLRKIRPVEPPSAQTPSTHMVVDDSGANTNETIDKEAERSKLIKKEQKKAEKAARKLAKKEAKKAKKDAKKMEAKKAKKRKRGSED